MPKRKKNSMSNCLFPENSMFNCLFPEANLSKNQKRHLFFSQKSPTICKLLGLLLIKQKQQQTYTLPAEFFMGSNFNNIPNLSFAINNLKWDTSMAHWQPQKVPRYLVYFQDSLMEVLLLSFFFFFFGVSSVNIAVSSSWTSSPL